MDQLPAPIWQENIAVGDAQRQKKFAPLPLQFRVTLHVVFVPVSVQGLFEVTMPEAPGATVNVIVLEALDMVPMLSVALAVTE